MKTKHMLKFAVATLLVLNLNSQLSTVFAQATAFTYQGRLNGATGPVTGSYDLTFTLFNSSAGGSPFAGPVTNASVNVTNGLFTTTVDFGNAFTGASNWLAVAVRTNGANNFVTLSPRQQLTPTPYAIYAESANAGSLIGTIPAANLSVANLPGVALIAGTNTFNGTQIITGGNVGIGTTTPQLGFEVDSQVYGQAAAQFDVANCGATCGQSDYQEAIRLWNQNGNGQVGLGFLVGAGSFNSNAVPDVWIGTAYGAYTVGGHANDFQISTTTNSIGTNLVNRFYINGNNGNVGIGTSAPSSDSLLQVKGMVRMGSETGTSEAPNRSILVRRINSASSVSNQVVAMSLGGTMTLDRDGTTGGLIIKINSSGGGVPQITGFGINASGATVNVYNILYGGGANSTTQIFTDAQHIGYCRLMFGDAYNDSDMTTVELMRTVDNGGNNFPTWVGTVTSTVNQ